MTTDWAVSTATERVNLDSARRVQVTFTVTNPGSVADRAVFEIVASDTADRSWFTVELPQRLVSAGATVPYVVNVEIPPQAPAGSYWLQARVYSADTAPEESSKLSGRVAFDVAGTAAPAKPWWLLIAVLMVVLVLGVAGYLVFSGGDDPPPPKPPATQGPVTMPDLTALAEADAVGQLQALGLQVGVSYRHEPGSAGAVLSQGVAAGTELSAGDSVEIEVAVALGAPGGPDPGNGQKLNKGTPFPTLTWQPVQYAASYQVTVETHLCAYAIFFIECLYASDGKWGSYYSDYHARSSDTVTGPSWSPSIELRLHPDVPRAGHSGHVRWWVEPIDAFGNVGPKSEVFTFYIPLRTPDEWGQP